MKPKIEVKLIKILSQFIGNELKHAQFKNCKINGKKILVLELIFSDEGVYKSMILILNKKITESNYKFIGEKLCQ